MFSLESFHKQYETDTTEVVIRGQRYTLFLPNSLDCFVNQEDIFHDFPLWAKVWEASMVLADHLAAMPVTGDKRFLEIGCGLGLTGIVASAAGHHVTMTESDAHALNFARANAAKNLPKGGANLQIVELDWNNPQLKGKFDTIFGSEVVYRREDFSTLTNLIETYLDHGGDVILAESARETSLEFFRQMQEVFDVRGQKKTIHTGDRQMKVILCTMRRKG